MRSGDTIVAVSSAIGSCGRVIVRLSGGDAHPIAREVAPGAGRAAGAATQALVYPGVRAWVYRFVGPRSYTGEDSVEFHVPGSAVVARMLLDELARLGARQAEAGEFTARAYFNGRMDLTQAEGVAATIGAQSERELVAAQQLLAGELARRVAPVMDSIAHALALVEVGIDFTDEDVTFISGDEVRGRCVSAAGALSAILNESARFERLSHEPRVVLVGRPNAGKSTLLNRLSGQARAVVSATAGTTRDAIWADVRLRRGVVRVVDVAGVEEVGDGRATVGSAEAEIAAQMMGQAMREVGEADVVVRVVEAGDARRAVEVGRRVDLVVRSKSDLGGASGGIEGRTRMSAPPGRAAIPVSSLTSQGVDEFLAHLDGLAFGAEAPTATLAINARHVRALEDAVAALGRAREVAGAGAEVVAMELREALDHLGAILGKVSPDDLLGRVFAQFCIGK